MTTFSFGHIVVVQTGDLQFDCGSEFSLLEQKFKKSYVVTLVSALMSESASASASRLDVLVKPF